MTGPNPVIRVIDEYLKEIDELIEIGEKSGFTYGVAQRLVAELSSVVPDIERGLSCEGEHGANMISTYHLAFQDPEGDLRLIRIKLLNHRAFIEEKNMEINVSPVTNINNSSNASASSLSSSQTEFSSALSAVRSCEGLDEDRKKVLELLLFQIRQAAEDKDENSFTKKVTDAIECASEITGLVPKIVKAAGLAASLF